MIFQFFRHEFSIFFLQFAFCASNSKISFQQKKISFFFRFFTRSAPDRNASSKERLHAPPQKFPRSTLLQTLTSVSGENAFVKSTLETTQISVHTPINSTLSKFSRRIYSASSTLANKGLSNTLSPDFCSPPTICHPSLSFKHV